MSISLGVLSFGVEADTKKLDKNINDADKKINRFSMLGVQRLNSLNSFNINSASKKIDTLNEKLEKLQDKSKQASQKYENMCKMMTDRGTQLKEILDFEFDTSQNTKNRMTTTEYNDRLSKILEEDKQYQKLKSKAWDLYHTNTNISKEIDRTNQKLTNVNKTMNKAGKIQGFNNTINSIGNGIKNISSKIGSVISKTLKWGIALLGVGGAVSLIARGVNSYLDTNPQVKANLDYMVYAIGQALAPAIQWVINLFQNLLAIVGAIAQVFFGVNIFANSFANYMKQANKNAKATKKSLGQLAGFDEINNIGANDNTGASGSSITMPDFNLENKIGEWIPKIEELKNKFEEWKWAILGVVGALALIKIGSLLGLAAPVIAGIVLIFARIRLYNTGHYKYG